MSLKTPDWSKSYIIRPTDYLKSHVFINVKERFKPSYEKEGSPPTMDGLLSWEYSRQWRDERDKFREERRRTQKRFKNDYKSWLQKHKPRQNESLKSQCP